MTEQNTLTTEQQPEVYKPYSERQYAIMLGSRIEYIVSHPEEYPDTIDAVEEQIQSVLNDYGNARAREVVKEMIEASDTIIGKIKSIENPPEAQSAITHSKGFIYGVEALAVDIKRIALSHGIDLSNHEE
jgi:hypothetical protein